ncbi:MAG: hypothetical protein E7624_02870 [Ruminococcaceae bacterium]|nr:hypothetical protein [Oscillospiraceae bacterium]
MPHPRDGDLYKRITLHGVSFELRYGYYEEFERASGEPIPIYPDFEKEPRYTAEGHPFVTAMQNACPHHHGADPEYGCHGCLYYKEGEELIGICTCEQRKQK